ncbi:RNA-binding protein [Allobranchiibius sp. CTAmp26]|uniref:RNA-binding protein n=1 Tax=Allobranchiibius sp. CTAmp26 TaxID=2815214 RepID=UPI001AA13F65|nr:RNA-binding protein [Allobranchiibius sp. CTAmp26]MBO1755211.1 RNA-binding protein [Allobranchiibius sp. CTAmp26]
MGLIHPRDLTAWQDWQDSRHRMRRAAERVRRPSAPSPFVLDLPRDASPRVLVALDVTDGPKRQWLLDPLADLPVAVLTQRPVPGVIAGERVARHVSEADLPGLLPDVRAVLSYGHYLAAGSIVHAFAERSGRAQLVLQHGLLTPYQPPLPPHAHALAWSAADADFWTDGRDDATAQVVGSQLLAAAALEPADTASREAPPTYLGQLHGAELPRRGLAQAAYSFCRDTGATYRPHPSETDRLSRSQHRVWERRGIRLDRSGAPLRQHDGPVAAAFSTGVLEAAARGVPAFVHYPHPPRWLEQFWARYDMRPWGGEPTPAPSMGAHGTDPAAAIRAAVIDVSGRTGR